ncbi:MAG: trigger factor [SAR202 cluster bacterium]|nr:trigger factor [Chloroflexota bacterium]MQG22927.1 trigger factor [SAR202 cluster bacterium]
MKITQDDIEQCQTVLHIELDEEDIDPYLNKAYKKVVSRVNIPGFRKGKAPRSIIEQYFGKESLINEELDSMLPELTSKAISQQELDIVGMPSISLEKMDPISFSATVPLTPSIDLGDYSSIRVKRKNTRITKKVIDERIEQLRTSVAAWEPADRKIQTGDMVSANIVGVHNDDEVINEPDGVYLVSEEIERPFPGFANKLIGLESDKPSTFELDIPKDFNDEKLAGNTISFNVTVKDIKERILPEVTDEFAQSLGAEYEDLDSLKSEIRKSLKSEAEAEAIRDFRENIISELIDTATIELPPLLVQLESEHMVNEQERMVQQANMVLDDYLQSIGTTREQLTEESKTEAVNRLNRSFILSKLADVEEIEISNEEIETRIEELFADSEENLPNASQTIEMKDYLERSMKMEKTIERLEQIAEGKNIPVKDGEDKDESSS